jgi:hypothetical protein
MVTMTRTIFSGLIALALLLSPLAQAEQFQQFGNYQVHYSAVNTSFLTPEVATASGITRSRATAFLNVSVLELQPDGSTKAVHVPVDGTVSTLSGQAQPLSFRTLRDGESIYRIATFGIQDGEPMRFELSVSLERNEPPVVVNFVRRLYVDR